METLEILSDMLATTDDIKSIVRTMKALSAVSIRQYEQAERAVSDYERTVNLGLTALLRDQRTRDLAMRATFGPGPAVRGGGGEGLIVIGSDRGLCGRYNESVARAVTDHMKDRKVALTVIGARGAARLEAEGHDIDRFFLLPGSVAGMNSLVWRVIVEIERWMREEGVETVRVIHNRRERQSSSAVTERTLLPIPAAEFTNLAQEAWPGRGVPFFRMDRSRLLSWLVRQRLFVLLYRALAEALASEHATRLAAMQRAERNIEERREDLTSAYRRKRQETITREMLDVISGFEAVQGSGG